MSQPSGPSDQELRELVSLSCKILYSQGQEHFYLGHISARAPGSEKVWVKPSGLGLGEIEPEDVIAIDLDGNQLTEGRPAHKEMPIHTEIYRARPDVNCVVHTHPFYAAAYAAADAEFQYVSQDGVLFADGVGHYRSAPLVVRTEQGVALAKALGSHKAVVLKNHGIAVVSSSVQDATFLALSFDRSLRMQHAASQFGPIDPISPEEVREMNEYFDSSYGGRIEATWDYMLRQAGLAKRTS
jgi:L-fuculose-phosphate aldolase